MIRNLKALGLALCAVFAFGAISASMASAETTDVLTSPVNDTYVTGKQIGGIGVGNEFSTKWEPNAKVECATGTYAGTFLGAATSVSVSPSYTGCKAAGLNATIDTTGCKFILTGTTDTYTNTSNVDTGKDATVSLDCGDTSAIKVTAPLGCTITFADTHPANTKVNQNRLGVVYDNEFDGVTWDVKVTVTVDKITYSSTGPCQALGITATDSDGFLTTKVTVQAYKDAAHLEKTNLTVS